MPVFQQEPTTVLLYEAEGLQASPVTKKLPKMQMIYPVYPC